MSPASREASRPGLTNPSRCLDDVDDEVRDRAAMYLRIMKDDPLADVLVKDGMYLTLLCLPVDSLTLLSSESTYSLSALESKLVSYITSSASAEKPFDIVSIPKISKEQARQEAQRARSEASSILPSASAGPSAPAEAVAGPSPSAAEAQSRYAEQLKAVPDFKDYGEVLRSSSKPVELTESETEYVVNCVKHIFKEHIVFQVRYPRTH